MAVSNYNLEKCKYNFSKLKPVLYLVSEDHLKEVYIDDYGAHISGLTELPLMINGFNIQFNEESSLDERYQFQKTLTLSMHGYVNYKIFGGRQYAIIENESGQRFMINVDFPSRITHTFNLSNNVNQTDFTFSCFSNFPTLKLDSDFEGVTPVCLGFNVYGIEKLELLEKEKTALNTASKTVVSTESFKNIEFLGKSCSFQEVYNGFDVTDTISFDIPFDSKLGWNWKLLEFLENKYAAIITPKGASNRYFSGFGIGLTPKYTIQTSTQAGQSDIITITLTEASNYGATAAVDWSEEQSTITTWRYVKQVEQIVCYECIGLGRARYLVKQEVTGLGVPTGNYQAMEGYDQQYESQGLNVVGIFSTTQEFDENSCTDFEACDITTTMPTTLVFTAVTSYTYSLKTSCDWTITNIPTGISVSPVSGVADTNYNVTISNTITPTSTPYEKVFNLQCCNTSRIVNLKVQQSGGCINPSSKNINCLGQNVTFSYNGNCQPNITSIPSDLTYSWSNNQLIIHVPRNEATSARTFTITVTNCNCSSNSTSITINQDKTYEQWVADYSSYVCVSGNSYVLERRYTGATSTNINVQTSETRAGALIQAGDSRCSSSQTRWVWDNKYYCVNGNKYKAEEEEISYDNGTTWAKTGNTRLGDFVEASSSFCSQETTYKWELTSNWVCEDIPAKFKATYSDSRTYSVECDSNTTLTRAITKPEGYTYSSMTEAEIGDCVTSIGDYTFSGCYSLTSVTIPDSVTTIGREAFYMCSVLKRLNSDIDGMLNIPSGVTDIASSAFERCSGLTSVVIPDSVISIGGHVFDYCRNLTSVTIGSGVTYIGSSAFNHCDRLTNITIPDSVTYISMNAFIDCSGLTNVTMGSNVTTIGEQAFAYCSSLTSIGIKGSGASVEIPSGVTSINARTFMGCISLTSVTIPNGVTTIGDRAFYDCSGLTSCTIGSGVTSIGYDVFVNCSSLTSITCLATTPPTLGSGVFDNTNNCPIYVPSGSVTAYKSASGWSDYSSRITAIT